MKLSMPKRWVGRFILIALASNWIPLAGKSDVMISIKPSQQMRDNIQRSLLKTWAHDESLPEWLQTFNFKPELFHLTLGYLHNRDWNFHKQAQIQRIVDHELSKMGDIHFTFDHPTLLGETERTKGYLVMEPDQVSSERLQASEEYIHSVKVNGSYFGPI